MGVIVALPKQVALAPEEVAVTLVVPAPQGCNLNCAFCFIRARREADVSKIVLRESDYVAFVEEMAARRNVKLVSLQGYEPLLPESWPISKVILAKAAELGIRTAIVTNGTHLVERVEDLIALGVGGLTVSLDADQAAWHDLTRRTVGAFARTMAGIRRVADSQLRDQLIIASVLQRGKAHYIAGMPKLLSDLGLRTWVVTAMYKVGIDTDRATVEPPADVVRELIALHRESLRQGISMLVDDEFEALIRNAGEAIDLAQLRLRRFSRLNQVVRLSPDGSCAIGKNILRPSNQADFLWNPSKESVSTFAEQVAALV